MDTHIEVKKIFLASPSDTINERRSANQTIEEINNLLGDTLKIKFEIIKWETHATPAMGRPQGIINKQLRIEQCDIFVGIIWKRFGTPTGEKNNKGVDYASGTEEEFDYAYKLWLSKGKPEIYFFKSTKAPKNIKDFDVKQLDRINSFFKQFSFDCEHPGLYQEYKTNYEFKECLQRTLIKYAINHYQKVTNRQAEEDISLPKKLTQFGLQNIFVPKLNDLRNRAKMNSLNNTTNISLIAHSGYSFIAQFGHRFRNIVEEKLKKGYSFRAILTNPWSESGFFISFSEVFSQNSNNQFIINNNGKKYLDCIKIIEQAKWYQVKFSDSLNGYKYLRKKYGDKIQIKFTRFEIQSSILITDDECYIEPYLPVNLEERYEKGMLTFELKLSNTSYLYNHNKKYFEFLWNLSDDIDKYKSNIDTYKKQLENKLLLNLEV